MASEIPNTDPLRSESHDAADDMPDPFIQNLFVMRHGERSDDEPDWVSTAARPWDPPITERGKLQAWEVGKNLRTDGWDITRVVVSPFLRCIQTAAEVIAALCMVESSSDANSSRDAVIDPVQGQGQVSIEYGLGELMNGAIICNHPPAAVVDSTPWTLQLSELHALLPSGTLDNSVALTWPKLPAWGESFDDGLRRYCTVIQAVADKFCGENVLCITHGGAVAQSVSHVVPRAMVLGVNYCAHSHAQRPIYSSPPEGDFIAGDWELVESGLPWMY